MERFVIVILLLQVDLEVKIPVVELFSMSLLLV